MIVDKYILEEMRVVQKFSDYSGGSQIDVLDDFKLLRHPICVVYIERARELNVITPN